MAPMTLKASACSRCHTSSSTSSALRPASSLRRHSLPLRSSANSASSPSSRGQPALQLGQLRLLAQRDPEDAVGKGPPHLGPVGQGAGQHALADPAHPLQPNPRRRAADHHRLLQVDQQQIAQSLDAVRLRQEARRQLGNRHQLAHRRNRLGELPDQVREVRSYSASSRKSSA